METTCPALRKRRNCNGFVNNSEMNRRTQIALHKAVGDIDEIGQTSGSRNSDGNVPNVNWNDDKLNVNWYNVDNANDNLRAREVASSKKSRLARDFIVIAST